MVVAIIGLLISIVISSLSNTKASGRDARQMSDLKQIQNALELYYTDNGQYPARSFAQTSSEPCGGNLDWYNLVADLSPYIAEIPGDPLGHQINYRYYYDANSGDNYQTYGMMIRFEFKGNYNKVAEDGGFFDNTSNGSFYEVGQQPQYYMNKYTSPPSGLWTNPTFPSNVCLGGN